MSEKIKVLIIEDDLFLRSLIARKLESEGFGVGMAIDGEDGIAKVLSYKPNLILLDIILPKMNGFEVLEKLKSDETIKHIPVILLTNLGEKEDADKGMSLGASDYMIKAHFTPEEIIEKIKKVIGS